MMEKLAFFALILMITIQVCITGPVGQLSVKSNESNPQTLSIASANMVHIMPGSFVDKTTKFGDNVFIGYFVQVGLNAIIGDNVILLADTIIPSYAKIPDNEVVINGPFTNDLISILQDLKSINKTYRADHQSEVDSILHDVKGFDVIIVDKIKKIFEDLRKNVTTFVKSGELYVVLRAYLQHLYSDKLNEMLEIQNNDGKTPQNGVMSTIHFQKNSTNGADFELANNYLRKLLAIYNVYMSSVTQNLDEFSKLAIDIVTDKRKVVTAQEIMKETNLETNPKFDGSKSDAILNAEKLVAKIPPGTLVGGGWFHLNRDRKQNNQIASSSTSASDTTNAADTKGSGSGWFSGLSGEKKSDGWFSGLLRGKKNDLNAVAPSVPNVDSVSSHSAGSSSISSLVGTAANTAHGFINSIKNHFPSHKAGDFVSFVRSNSFGRNLFRSKSADNGKLHTTATQTTQDIRHVDRDADAHNDHSEHKKVDSESKKSIHTESFVNTGGLMDNANNVIQDEINSFHGSEVDVESHQHGYEDLKKQKLEQKMMSKHDHSQVEQSSSQAPSASVTVNLETTSKTSDKTASIQQGHDQDLDLDHSHSHFHTESEASADEDSQRRQEEQSFSQAPSASVTLNLETTSKTSEKTASIQQGHDQDLGLDHSHNISHTKSEGSAHVESDKSEHIERSQSLVSESMESLNESSARTGEMSVSLNDVTKDKSSSASTFAESNNSNGKFEAKSQTSAGVGDTSNVDDVV